LLECLSILDRGVSTGIYKSKEEFYKKTIYVEIWEDLDIKSILYKMLILNTGQKKMDYKHQLDILGDSMKPMLDKKGIKYYTVNENKNGKDVYPLSLIVSGFVSLVGQKPIKQKKNAAEYLFNKFDIDIKSNEEDTTLNLISDEETYNYLKWVLVDFNNLLNEKYNENNPLNKYEVFINALLGSIGHCHVKKPENLKKKIIMLQESFSKSDDPIKLDKFEVIYKGFKTGIGDKRRNFIFGSFRNYFLAPEYVEFDWDEDYAQL
ncbi:MAG: hypothetical protein ACRC3Y_10965, partial [Romboutsia sp.]|uniref:hypothetical protein n=1 Tax=Romboutsia sp. TaxID=1965302 RepID=UPI003F2D8658